MRSQTSDYTIYETEVSLRESCIANSIPLGQSKVVHLTPYLRGGPSEFPLDSPTKNVTLDY